MQLRELIGQVGMKYDRKLPMSSEAQQLLRQAGSELQQWVPGTYLAVGSGGKGNGASCPWIAVFDPGETTTAQHGMYVVYLFAEDMSTVALSLNQGVTEFRAAAKRTGIPAREALSREAAAIRAAFSSDEISDLDTAINLHTKATLPVDYEHGNIVARTYNVANLPSEAAIVDDLKRFVRVYELALEAREEERQQGNTEITTPSRHRPAKKRIAEFKPKNAGEYRKFVEAREIVVHRRRERLIAQYGQFLGGRGFRMATNVHPRDLTAEHSEQHWLIEAKMVRAGNAEPAAREALAQLIFYRRFLYSPDSEVRQLALFSEDVGPAFVDLLEDLGIATVWQTGNGWGGSSTARANGLC